MYNFSMLKRTTLLLLVLTCSFAHAEADLCRDILKDGTRASSLYHTNYQYRRLLESKLLTMSYQQAKSDTSITGSIPIGDIVLGAGFDETSFNSFRSYLQNDTVLTVDVSKEVAIMLSTGDPNIVGAWRDCMKSKTGLSIYFSSVGPKTAVLHLQWAAALGVTEVKVSEAYKPPKGVRIVSGVNIMNGKEAIKAGTSHEVQFEFESPRIPLTLVLNVKKPEGGLAGADTAYLPARFESYVQSRPYQPNTGACDKTGLFGVDTRHNSGNSISSRFCTDITNGWRFTSGSLQVLASVAIPGQIPGTFANHQEFWSGNNQVTVLLGCSNSSGTDIQCQAQVSAQEERTLWREQTDTPQLIKVSGPAPAN